VYNYQLFDQIIFFIVASHAGLKFQLADVVFIIGRNCCEKISGLNSFIQMPNGKYIQILAWLSISCEVFSKIGLLVER
jgi:hypothetical protein